MDKEGVAQQKAKSAKISYKIKIFAIHLTNLTLSFIIKYGYYYSLSRLIDAEKQVRLLRFARNDNRQFFLLSNFTAMENGESITHTEDGITESPDNVTTERPGNVTGQIYRLTLVAWRSQRQQALSIQRPVRVYAKESSRGSQAPLPGGLLLKRREWYSSYIAPHNCYIAQQGGSILTPLLCQLLYD